MGGKPLVQYFESQNISFDCTYKNESCFLFESHPFWGRNFLKLIFQLILNWGVSKIGVFILYKCSTKWLILNGNYVALTIFKVAQAFFDGFEKHWKKNVEKLQPQKCCDEIKKQLSFMYARSKPIFCDSNYHTQSFPLIVRFFRIRSL